MRTYSGPKEGLLYLQIESRDLNIKEAAAEIKISRQTLMKILHGERGITPHVAELLETWSGLHRDVWLMFSRATPERMCQLEKAIGHE